MGKEEWKIHVDKEKLQVSFNFIDCNSSLMHVPTLKLIWHTHAKNKTNNDNMIYF